MRTTLDDWLFGLGMTGTVLALIAMIVAWIHFAASFDDERISFAMMLAPFVVILVVCFSVMSAMGLP